MYSMTPSHLDGDICFGTAYTNNITTGSQDALQYVLYFDVSTRPIDATVINVCNMLYKAGWIVGIGGAFCQSSIKNAPPVGPEVDQSETVQ